MAEATERDDEQRFARVFFMRGTPATWGVIGANVAVFVLMSIAAKSIDAGSVGYTLALVNFGAKIKPLIDQGQYWRLVNPMFIHIGVLHLGVNMYSLYAIGPQVERLYGTARFLILYLLSGIAGVVASYFLSTSAGPSAGASGALFGLLGVLLVFGVRYRSELPGMFRQAFNPRGLIPVLALNLFITFTIPIIDKWAHLGGLFAGAALAAVVPYFRSNESRASAVWRGFATLLVLITVASFAMAIRAPRLGEKELGTIFAQMPPSSDAGSLDANLIKPYNDAGKSLAELSQALVRAADKQAVLPAVAERAHATAGESRNAKGVDARTRALFERSAKLLDSGASLLENRQALAPEAVRSFQKDREALDSDWKAWFDDEAKHYGLTLGTDDE